MKHDHKKTKKLKVALFSMIMFLPFIAIGVTCATHIFNKEVTEETETATINYEFEIGTTPQYFDELQINTLYKLNVTPDNDIGGEMPIKYITDNVNTFYQNTNSYVYIDVQLHDITLISGDMEISFNIDNTYIVQWTKDINDTDLWHNYTNGNNDYNIIQSVEITTNPQDQTTNIFYDSCEQVEQSFILNWCEQANPVRNPIQSFTNAFNLPSNHIINTLITYWICITMIYIVIDIIVECIVMLTHFFNKEL